MCLENRSYEFQNIKLEFRPKASKLGFSTLEFVGMVFQIHQISHVSLSIQDIESLDSLEELLIFVTFFFCSQLDYAAKVKSTPQAEKYYAEAVSTLNDVLSKIG